MLILQYITVFIKSDFFGTISLLKRKLNYILINIVLVCFEEMIPLKLKCLVLISFSKMFVNSVVKAVAQKLVCEAHETSQESPKLDLQMCST